MNNKLTYISEVRVLLDRRQVGTIKTLYDTAENIVGYRYFPKGSKDGGDTYTSMAACKQSLETLD